MNILMISADPKVFEQGSEAVKRIDDYRALVDDLRVLVIARPWNLLGFLRGYRDGVRLLKTWHGKDMVITSQDPAERWLIAWLLARRFNAPLELQIHTDLLSKFFWRESLKNKIRVLFARFLLPRATTIRVVSERIKRSLMKQTAIREEHITVLPISIVIARNEVTKQSHHSIDNATGLIPPQLRGRNDGVFTFLMVSRFTKEKNIPLALQAFAKVNKGHSNTRLIIVGSGPEEQALKSLASSFQLPASSFQFVGWQDNLEPYWRQADAYLLTSNYEGYGRTVVAALSHGVPVVMTDVGVAGEMVKNGENGFVVPVGDEQALAQAMQKAMNYQWQFFPLVLFSKGEYLKRVKEHWEYAWQRFSMPRLVYILPEYHPDADTHFYYLDGFIKKISERLRLSVIEEKRQRFWLLPKLIWLRMRGFRDFYVHYSFYGALMSILTTNLFGGRVLYWNCGMPWLYEKERSWFEERLFRFILRHAILVTGTAGMAQQYRTHYQLKENCVRVMPNWIDLSLYHNLPSREEARELLGIPQEKKVALFVHRLSSRKGSHRIMPIVDTLQDISDILFIIVGSGPEEDNIKLQASRFMLQDMIRFEGSIPAHRVPLYMRAADVFFMPSDEEGFPHVLLEAMVVGTPFVASNVGGVAEIIPEEMRQFLCQPNDVVCFAKNIKYFLYNRNDVAKKMPAFVERYDRANVAEQFVLLYK